MRVVRLFQCTVYGWLVLYLLAVLITGTAAWSNAPVPLLGRGHPLSALVDPALLAEADPHTWMVLTAITMIMAVTLLFRHRWWAGLAVWILFRMITHRMWLASNGGVQLMENMLFWCALMGDGTQPFIHTTAYWAARLQLVLVYAASAAHKLTGTTWLDGTAVALVARDPALSLGWLLRWPGFCSVLTWSALGFMLLFPVAVWWRPSRLVVLTAGVLFHLSTAIFMGIPQMGLAFIACYAIWLDEGTIARLRKATERFVRSIARA